MCDFEDFMLFDIFKNNDKIYLVCSRDVKLITQEDVNVSMNTKKLKFCELIVKTENSKDEDILILVYNKGKLIEAPSSNLTFEVSYKNKTEIFTNKEYKPSQNYFLTLTTLFKDDYELFPIFYNYYKDQGVEHFFMYYNGKLNDTIRNVFNKNDVTLIEWDFRYWNWEEDGSVIMKKQNIRDLKKEKEALKKARENLKNIDKKNLQKAKEKFEKMKNQFKIEKEKLKKELKKNEESNKKNKEKALNIYRFRHHAQPAQMNHAVYKYGKNISNYMIFCDLDEYLHIDNFKLKEFIQSTNYDLYGFCNIWSRCKDYQIPESFQNEFLISDIKWNYEDRSKNIFKIETVKTVSVHRTDLFNKSDIVAQTDFNMFHFCNWTKKDRIMSGIDIPIKL